MWPARSASKIGTKPQLREPLDHLDLGFWLERRRSGGYVELQQRLPHQTSQPNSGAQRIACVLTVLDRVMGGTGRGYWLD